MNNLLSIVFIVVIFIVTYLAGQFLQKSEGTPESIVHKESMGCSPVASPCRVAFDVGDVVVRFLQQPSALTPFDIEVLTTGFDAENVAVAFVMRDMNMGGNSFNLDFQSKRSWRSKILLPVCSLARTDWIAEVSVKYNNAILRVDYRFEQAKN